MKMIVCSLIDAEGSCKIAGKEWRWEFHEYLGPTFVTKAGEPLKNQPSEKHPVWDRFSEWLTEYRKTHPVK